MRRKRSWLLVILLIGLGMAAIGLDWGVPSPPSQFQIANWQEIQVLLREYFPNACGCQGARLIVDDQYQIVALQEIQRLLQEDKTEQMPRDGEFLDTDDFVFRLLGQFSTPGWSGIPFGFVYTKEAPYFYNIFITRESGRLVVYRVDPKRDQIEKMVNPDQEAVLVVI